MAACRSAGHSGELACLGEQQLRGLGGSVGILSLRSRPLWGPQGDCFPGGLGELAKQTRPRRTGSLRAWHVSYPERALLRQRVQVNIRELAADEKQEDPVRARLSCSSE